MTLRCFTIALLAAMASACATSDRLMTSDLRHTLAPFQESDEGRIVFSAGAPDACYTKAAVVRIDDAAGRPTRYNFLDVDISLRRSEFDFSDQAGFVYAVNLRAGHYSIMLDAQNPALEIANPRRFDFTVTSQQTTYLGEFFRETPCEWTLPVNVRDRYDRDLAIIRAANPGQPNIEIVRDLAEVRQR